MLQQPWLLVQNQVRASGGREMDRFRGVRPEMDRPDGAEAWVGSVTRANGVTPENPDLGCAEVIFPDGTKKYLYEVIDKDPEGVLGCEHIKRFGTGTGVLVKLLDAKDKFLLQCHPTRDTAKKVWNSEYGKTECWHVLSVRDDVPEPPYILLGFKPGFTRERFEEIYRTGTIDDMEKECNKIPVHPGETYFVPGGMPHALGAGCFVIEIQEPSDLTAIPAKQQVLLDYRRAANPRGVFTPIDEEIYNLRTLSSFDYTGRSFEQVITETRSEGIILREGGWGRERILIGRGQTDYFSCTEIDVHGEIALNPTGRIMIGIVAEGGGRLISPYGEIVCRRGTELFFPVQANDIRVEGNMRLILCHPDGANILHGKD